VTYSAQLYAEKWKKFWISRWWGIQKFLEEYLSSVFSGPSELSWNCFGF